ncbi:MAG: ABC transporter ATP-binding protein [Taibaiella sp.]|nr:ABC transporter ATP-binding protein [Taibaiella sp.]
MKITLGQVGKRFQRHRIFKDVNYSFISPGAYALLGPNGSGKSTLLRIIAGMQQPSAGKVLYAQDNDREIKPDKVFEHISFCAPGQELVEEFTLREFLDFHFSFKKPLQQLTTSRIIDITGLSAAADKPIYDYSSGMKQRVKLVQAIFANTPALFLDEPCTNLDEAGVAQYRAWMDTYTPGRLVIIASNDPREYDFCSHHLVMEEYL